MAVKFNKAKSALYGVACAAALMSSPASAQVPVIGSLPILSDLSGGGLPIIGSLSGGGLPIIGSLSDGGLPIIGSLSGGGLPGLDILSSGGIPLLGNGLPLDILSLDSLLQSVLGVLPLVGGSGGLGGLEGLDSLALGELGALTSVTGLLGFELPPIATGLLTGGLNSLFALGLDFAGDASVGGVAEIPLVGKDLAYFLTAEGLTEGLEGLITSYRLPIGLPVVGRDPLQLYAPVVFSALGTQGLDLGSGAIPNLGEILGGGFGGGLAIIPGLAM